MKKQTKRKLNIKQHTFFKFEQNKVKIVTLKNMTKTKTTVIYLFPVQS